MPKYDDFDLDIQNQKTVGTIGPNSIAITYTCHTITKITLQNCTAVSEAICPSEGCTSTCEPTNSGVCPSNATCGGPSDGLCTLGV